MTLTGRREAALALLADALTAKLTLELGEPERALFALAAVQAGARDLAAEARRLLAQRPA